MIYVSLIMGFMAWALAALAIIAKKRPTKALLVGTSFFSCCISALCPLFMISGYVDRGDVGTVEDVIRGFIFGVATMMGITLILIFFALKRLSK